MTPNDQLTPQINAELRPRTAGEEVAAQVGVVAVRALTTAAGAARDLVAGTISAVNSFASNPEVQAAAASALSAAAGGVRAVADTAAAAITGSVQTITDPVVQATMQQLVAEGGRRISGAASSVAHSAADLASRSLQQLTAVAIPGQVPLITAPLDDGEFTLCDVDVNGDAILEDVIVPLIPPTADTTEATPAKSSEAQAPIATATPDGGECHAAVDDSGAATGAEDLVTPVAVADSPAVSRDRHEQPLSALLAEEDGAPSESSDDGVISFGPNSPLDPLAPDMISGSAVGSPITLMYDAATAPAAVIEVAGADGPPIAVAAPAAVVTEIADADGSLADAEPAPSTVPVQQPHKKPTPKPKSKKKR